MGSNLQVLFLDTDAVKAAKYIPDHLISWAAQQGWHVLRKALQVYHVNQAQRGYLTPWEEWAARMPGHMAWLCNYLEQVFDEYEHRYGRTHAYVAPYTQEMQRASQASLRAIVDGVTPLPPQNVPASGVWTVFPTTGNLQTEQADTACGGYRQIIIQRRPLTASWKRSKHGAPHWWPNLKKLAMRIHYNTPGVGNKKIWVSEPPNKHGLKQVYVRTFSSPEPTYPEG